MIAREPIDNDNDNDSNDNDKDNEESTMRKPLLLSNEDRCLLECPLSLELMQDPVTLYCTGRQRTMGHTYDRQWLCESLLAFPNLDPKSNLRYHHHGQKLIYAPNVPLQKILKRHGLYKPYDDSSFLQKYDKAWKNRYRNQDRDYFFLLLCAGYFGTLCCLYFLAAAFMWDFVASGVMEPEPFVLLHLILGSLGMRSLVRAYHDNVDGGWALRIFPAFRAEVLRRRRGFPE